MKVALIANHPKDTGVGRYAFTLFNNLRLMGICVELFKLDRASYRVYRILDENNKLTVKRINKSLVYDNLLFRKYDLSNLFFDYRSAKEIPEGYDLYHITNQVISNLSYYNKLKPCIITVHDLDYYTHPSSNIQKKLSMLVYKGIKRCEAIISISNYTKNMIIKHLKISDDKIRVIHHGVDEIFGPLKEHYLENIYDRYGLDKELYYILHVGVDAYRKNLIILLKAFKLLISDYGLKNTRLIKINRLTESTLNVVKDLDLQQYIIMLDYLPEEDLVKFYNLADVFVFPSIQEGFGFPVLEAMACGTPVVASNSASIPEIVGNAGILLDPYDVDGFAKVVYTVLTDESLRREMSKKGLKRARKFSWEKCAKEHLRVYEEVITQ